eukprot:gnl/Trimastix_PCT/4788.p1 GENE.gnl/Trimastix_PCT/4788~~gnl/Trimastix_PCT/4788.p1  ORF type:complete len:773 (+),score=159.82 gnl/Trimastix_PCT/4788:92-2410(+)
MEIPERLSLWLHHLQLLSNPTPNIERKQAQLFENGLFFLQILTTLASNLRLDQCALELRKLRLQHFHTPVSKLYNWNLLVPILSKYFSVVVDADTKALILAADCDVIVEVLEDIHAFYIKRAPDDVSHLLERKEISLPPPTDRSQTSVTSSQESGMDDSSLDATDLLAPILQETLQIDVSKAMELLTSQADLLASYIKHGLPNMDTPVNSYLPLFRFYQSAHQRVDLLVSSAAHTILLTRLLNLLGTGLRSQCLDIALETTAMLSSIARIAQSMQGTPVQPQPPPDTDSLASSPPSTDTCWHWFITHGGLSSLTAIYFDFAHRTQLPMSCLTQAHTPVVQRSTKGMKGGETQHGETTGRWSDVEEIVGVLTDGILAFGRNHLYELFARRLLGSFQGNASKYLAFLSRILLPIAKSRLRDAVVESGAISAFVEYALRHGDPDPPPPTVAPPAHRLIPSHAALLTTWILFPLHIEDHEERMQSVVNITKKTCLSLDPSLRNHMAFQLIRLLHEFIKQSSPFGPLAFKQIISCLARQPLGDEEGAESGCVAPVMLQRVSPEVVGRVAVLLSESLEQYGQLEDETERSNLSSDVPSLPTSKWISLDELLDPETTEDQGIPIQDQTPLPPSALPLSRLTESQLESFLWTFPHTPTHTSVPSNANPGDSLPALGKLKCSMWWVARCLHGVLRFAPNVPVGALGEILRRRFERRYLSASEMEILSALAVHPRLETPHVLPLLESTLPLLLSLSLPFWVLCLAACVWLCLCVVRQWGKRG